MHKSSQALPFWSTWCVAIPHVVSVYDFACVSAVAGELPSNDLAAGLRQFRLDQLQAAGLRREPDVLAAAESRRRSADCRVWRAVPAVQRLAAAARAQAATAGRPYRLPRHSEHASKV